MGLDSLPAELVNLDHPHFTRYFHKLLFNVWRTGDVLQPSNHATTRYVPS